LPRKAHLLIVDDDPNTLASLARAFRLAGHEATVSDNATRALELLRSDQFDLILSDVVMPGKSGLELLEDLKKTGIKTPIVLISGQANIEMAVHATKLGALDFLEKPLTTDKLLVTVENALRLGRLEDENRELRQRLGKHELVGSGPAMAKLRAQIDRVAASETRVCILGETGTGKELVARAIHEKSPRHENAFVTLNCAAVPAELIESELFGHEKGAFTGAAAKHLGKFEQADGGTLFLDEIGELPLAIQAKLLRVLEEKRFERVGGTQSIDVDLRIIVATNRDLQKQVQEKLFRDDLYFRVSTVPITIPPLRERGNDVLLLANHFLEKFSREFTKPGLELSEEARQLLLHYPWPGNVRELQNTMERAVILADGVTIHADALQLPSTRPDAANLPGGMLPEKFNWEGTLEQVTSRAAAHVEKALLETTMSECKWNKTRAAEKLGITPKTLLAKLRAAGLEE